MRVKHNETKFSSRALKTIATAVYKKLERELTVGQIDSVDWKNLPLHVFSASSNQLRSKNTLSIYPRCTQLEFAIYLCALLRWRANLKRPWDTQRFVSDFDETPITKKPPRKPAKKKETPPVENARIEYERATKRVKQLEDKLIFFKKEQKKLEIRKDRAKVALKRARQHLRYVNKKYLDASQNTAVLSTGSFAARMKAKRDAETDAPRSR